MSQRIVINWKSLFAHGKIVTWYRRFLSSRQFDVAIINSNEELMQRASLWKALKQAGIPTILTLRDPVLIDRNWRKLIPLYQKLAWFQAKWIQAYAAPSQFMLSMYEDAGFSMQMKRVIYNTIDLPCQKVGSKKRQILYVGAIAPYKGVLTLLKAVDLLQKQYDKNGIEFIMIGRNDLSAEEIEGYNVRILPWMPREQVYAHMRESLVVVLPSEWPEAFGRVLVEAVYNGTLAIGSNAGAIPELFDCDPRYVFPQKDADRLSEKLERVLNLSEQDYAAEVIEMQSRWEKFSVGNYVSAWEKYCMEAIDLYGKNTRPGR